MSPEILTHWMASILFNTACYRPMDNFDSNSNLLRWIDDFNLLRSDLQQRDTRQDPDINNSEPNWWHEVEAIRFPSFGEFIGKLAKKSIHLQMMIPYD